MVLNNKPLYFLKRGHLSFLLKSTRGTSNTRRFSETVRHPRRRNSTQLGHPHREDESFQGRIPNDSAREAPLSGNLESPQPDRLEVPSVVENIEASSRKHRPPGDDIFISTWNQDPTHQAPAEAAPEAQQAPAEAAPEAQQAPAEAAPEAQQAPAEAAPEAQQAPAEAPPEAQQAPAPIEEIQPNEPIEAVQPQENNPLSDISESDFSDSDCYSSTWEIGFAFGGGNNKPPRPGDKGSSFGDNFWFSSGLQLSVLFFAYAAVYLLLKTIIDKISIKSNQFIREIEKMRQKPKAKSLSFWKTHQPELLELGLVIGSLVSGPEVFGVVMRNLTNRWSRALVRCFAPFFKLLSGIFIFWNGTILFFQSFVFASKLGFTFENGLFNSLLRKYSFIFSTVALDPKVSFVEFISKSIVLGASSGLIFQFLFQIKLKKDRNSICVSVIFIFAFSFIIYSVFIDTSFFRGFASHLLEDSLFSELVNCRFGRSIIVFGSIFFSKELQIFFPNMPFIFVCLLYFYQVFPMVFGISTNLLPP